MGEGFMLMNCTVVKLRKLFFPLAVCFVVSYTGWPYHTYNWHMPFLYTAFYSMQI